MPMTRLASAVTLVLLAATQAQAQTQVAQTREEVENSWNTYTEWLKTETRPVEKLPAMYETWWRELEARCECTPVFTFVELQLYTVQGMRFKVPGKTQFAYGHHVPSTGVLVIASGYLNNKTVVQHEMLHMMLDLPGEQHPAIFGKLFLLPQDVR